MKKINEKTSDTESASDKSETEKLDLKAKNLAEAAAAEAAAEAAASSSSLADYSTSAIDNLLIKEKKYRDKEEKKRQIRRLRKINKLIKEKKLNIKKKKNIKFLVNPIKKIKGFFHNDDKSIEKLIKESSSYNSTEKHKTHPYIYNLDIISKIIGIIVAIIGAYYSFFK